MEATDGRVADAGKAIERHLIFLATSRLPRVTSTPEHSHDKRQTPNGDPRKTSPPAVSFSANDDAASAAASPIVAHAKGAGKDGAGGGHAAGVGGKTDELRTTEINLMGLEVRIVHAFAPLCKRRNRLDSFFLT